MTKINSLHYLRGLLAIGVMLSHYYSWPLGYGYYLNANHFLSRIGNYGVSLFFILSGLTLFHIYSEKKIFQKTNLKTYFIKRFFRIYPLFWIATFISLVFTNEHYDFQTIALNFSGLFSFTSSNMPILNVAWSIGNEIVFYCAFPIILILLQQRSWLYKCIPILLFLISFGLALHYFKPIGEETIFSHD